MTSPLALYEDGLRDPASRRGARARLRDGTVLSLPLERYLGSPDRTDEHLLRGVRGPVLDVGCGPGRHLQVLAARGIFAVGVDLSPVAVALAIGGGGRAIVADIFGELPGNGHWRTALLLDGNIGIGGAPVRLLRRVAGLLGAGGEALVELDAPDVPSGATLVRLERGARHSDWFPWARVSANAIVPVAAGAGFRVSEVHTAAGRWFARLRFGGPTAADGSGSPDGDSGSVP